jgi:hypothetical protein
MSLDGAPPLWNFILARLDPAPLTMSLDGVHQAIGIKVVGRGTVQRIKEGGEISLKSMRALADRLGCDVSVLDNVSAGLPADAPPPRAQPSLTEALSVVGRALAVKMPADIRQDAADLLAKLALREGAQRHQTELVSLLSPFEAMEVVPTQLGGRVDLDHATSHQPIKHAPAPQILGVDQPNEDGGGEWDLLNVGTPADVARPRGGASRQRKPGEKSPGKTSKKERL